MNTLTHTPRTAREGSYMNADDIRTLTEMAALHASLLERGHNLAARKTRYALAAFFDATLDAMRAGDGGRVSDVRGEKSSRDAAI